MAEAPWPSGDVDAELDWTPIEVLGFEGLGVLWFLSPETDGWHAGHRYPIHVSKTCGDGGMSVGTPPHTNVWRIVENGDGTVTVSPSVHFVGHFHSPRPVRFRIVESLGDREPDDG